MPPTDTVAAAAITGWYDCISADPSIPQTEERETRGTHSSLGDVNGIIDLINDLLML